MPYHNQIPAIPAHIAAYFIVLNASFYFTRRVLLQIGFLLSEQNDAVRQKLTGGIDFLSQLEHRQLVLQMLLHLYFKFMRAALLLPCQKSHDRMERDTLSHNGSSSPAHSADKEFISPPISSGSAAGPQAASSSDIITPAPLPSSVRGAPEELKPAIRKNQNKESARRSRHRRKELVSNLSRFLQILLQRTADIEARLANVEQFVSRLGFVAPPIPAPLRQFPDLLTSGSDRSVGESGGGRTEQGSVAQQPTLEDKELQLLIERCMGQL